MKLKIMSILIMVVGLLCPTTVFAKENDHLLTQTDIIVKELECQKNNDGKTFKAHWFSGTLTEDVNVRSSPSTNYEVWTTYEKGDLIFYFYENEHWAGILVGNQTFDFDTGYICADYIEMDMEYVKDNYNNYFD